MADCLTRDAAAAKERSPMVERRVDATTANSSSLAAGTDVNRPLLYEEDFQLGRRCLPVQAAESKNRKLKSIRCGRRSHQ